MARSSEPELERPGIVSAKSSFTHMFEGAPRQFNPGTTVRVGHPVLVGIEHLFEPITPDYELEGVKADYEVKGSRVTAPAEEFESATAAPNEKRGG